MSTIKKFTACIIGTKPMPFSQSDKIEKKIKKTITNYIERGYRYFGVGGVIGFEMLAAQTILNLKAEYPHIRLILVMPYVEQDKGWSEHFSDEYHRIQLLVDKKVYTSYERKMFCIIKKNRHLIANSSACICYSSSISLSIIYAKVRGLEIERIN